MNRRGFLGVLSAGLASTLLPGAAARAQAGEIRIGMSAAFRGSAAGLGSELYRGAHALLQRDQRAGRSLRAAITVVALDDGYNPDRASATRSSSWTGRRRSCSPTTWALRRSRARCP